MSTSTFESSCGASGNSKPRPFAAIFDVERWRLPPSDQFGDAQMGEGDLEIADFEHGDTGSAGTFPA